jgi:predicted phage terminase large subunit-like protein
MKKNDSSSWSNQFDNLSSQKQIATNLLIEWYDKARPTQLVEDSDEFNIHLFLAGRGWGKTLTGAYDIVEYCLRNDNVVCGVVAPTYGDLKRVVFSGDSGFINIIDRRLLSNTGYNKSDSEIHFYNGSKIIGFPAIEPDRLRGVQFHRAWCDELASWRYTETFDNLMMALRLGHNPKCIITTTPRPTKIIRSLAKRSDTKLITGSTFENIDNLAESSIEMLRERYEGTRIGRQELYAEILEDVEGALFNYKNIEENRLIEYPNDLQRIVVAIDPAVTSNQNSDETGMIVAGRDVNNHYYILHDASQISSPDEWVKKAISLYKQYECDRIVAEVNNGGDLIERLLRTQNQSIPYTSVRASRGKIVRAEPISALYEQNRVHHVGVFKDLEEQMCQFTGNGVQYHDDRVDALVWAITSLQNSGQAVFKIS